MANHILPTTSSLYTDVLANLKDRIDDSLKMLDSANTTPTNVPTNAVRWNSSTNLWEKYNGASWVSLAASYAISVSKATNLIGGNSTTLLGSIHYQSNTDISTLLAPNTTTTRKFLRQTGTGTNGAAPVWDTILATDVPTLNQNTTGSAAKLTTARTLSLTGDASGSMSFDGSANASSALTLATSGVTAGTYNNVTVDAKGRVTAGANLVFGTASTFDVHTARNNEANKVVRTDSYGYLQVGYINSSSGNENNAYGIGGIWGTNGSDNFMRTYQPEGVSVGYAKFQSSSVAGNSCAEVFYNTPAGNTSTRECNGWGDAPNGGWWIIQSLRHTNSYSYWGTQIAYGWENNANKIYQRNVSDGTWTSWYNQGLNSTGNPPNYACRAWVNFNGTGTVAIRESGNVSSITDNGVGDYTVNFTTAMPDINYAVLTNGSGNDSATHQSLAAPTTTSVRVDEFLSDINIYTDSFYFSVAIFR